MGKLDLHRKSSLLFLLTSRRGQTVVEYALATLAAFVIAMIFYLMFDLKIGKKNRNLMELQYYTIEKTVTKGWP